MTAERVLVDRGLMVGCFQALETSKFSGKVISVRIQPRFSARIPMIISQNKKPTYSGLRIKMLWNSG
jgi:hypothetical protein